jgi:hypothetical protein
MFRLILRPVLLLTLLSALPVVLIRAQLYDDSDLRAFLIAPAGCPAPCFMGIRPGVTTPEEANRILEQLGWTQTDTQWPIRSSLSWYWNSQQSFWIDAQINGIMGDTMDGSAYLEIRTPARVGDLRLLLGVPDKEQYRLWAVFAGAGSTFQYSAWYAEAGIEMIANGVCPVGSGPFNFNTPTLIRLRSEPPLWQLDTKQIPCRS